VLLLADREAAVADLRAVAVAAAMAYAGGVGSDPGSTLQAGAQQRAALGEEAMPGTSPACAACPTTRPACAPSPAPCRSARSADAHLQTFQPSDLVALRGYNPLQRRHLAQQPLYKSPQLIRR
jgi:hypothetical protein